MNKNIIHTILISLIGATITACNVGSKNETSQEIQVSNTQNLKFLSNDDVNTMISNSKLTNSEKNEVRNTYQIILDKINSDENNISIENIPSKSNLGINLINLMIHAEKMVRGLKSDASFDINRMPHLFQLNKNEVDTILNVLKINKDGKNSNDRFFNCYGLISSSDNKLSKKFTLLLQLLNDGTLTNLTKDSKDYLLKSKFKLVEKNFTPVATTEYSIPFNDYKSTNYTIEYDDKVDYDLTYPDILTYCKNNTTCKISELGKGGDGVAYLYALPFKVKIQLNDKTSPKSHTHHIIETDSIVVKYLKKHDPKKQEIQQYLFYKSMTDDKYSQLVVPFYQNDKIQLQNYVNGKPLATNSFSSGEELKKGLISGITPDELLNFKTLIVNLGKINVAHNDITYSNIVLENSKLILIDFDKCSYKETDKIKADNEAVNKIEQDITELQDQS